MRGKFELSRILLLLLGWVNLEPRQDGRPQPWSAPYLHNIVICADTPCVSIMGGAFPQHALLVAVIRITKILHV